MENILEIKNLHVSVADKEILKGVDMEIKPGETHVLMGPNGAGKSTLGHAIMSDPKYEVTEGELFFDGEDITEEGTDKRAKRGLFLSFQDPIPVPGISLGSFTRSAIEQGGEKHIKLWDFKKKSKEVCAVLNMDESYTERDLNVGFSGGEKKKAEIYQLLMLNPKLAILDETDSGLDVDAVKTVSAGVEEFKKNGGTLLIITHSTRILDNLKVDRTHILVDGKIAKTGGPELVSKINEEGFEEYLKQ
ncbi:MAG: Fe-S cluster assembly ATPase SufC [Lachnospiraceae bacterium]|nr:Fe-S cluster assembly ATPase SufC [Lachnospiraceae bacterium]